MSPGAGVGFGEGFGFPRLRGDEPPDMPGVNEQTVFSPPTRG